MRVLLDECVPKRLLRALTGHLVSTVPEMGWGGKKNGELLKEVTDAGFEVFVTVDQNIPHQKNLASAGISVIILAAVSNTIQDLLPLVPAALAAMATIKPGDCVVIR